MRAARHSRLLVGLLLVPLLSLLLFHPPSYAQTALGIPSLIIVPFAAVPQARGVAIDATGDMFSLAGDAGTIYKITPTGQVSVIADLPDITGGYVGPAFDPVSGDLFVSRYALGAGNEVLKITLAGAVSVFATGIAAPAGLAADGHGNLFVSSFICPDGAVYKITAAGVVSQFGSGLCHSDGVAIGPNGDLFIGDRGTQRIMRVPATGGAASVFAVGVGIPIGVAFDKTGKLFVADSSSGTIASVSSNGVVSPFASGLNFPVGLAFDPQNHMYVADFGANQIVTLENPPPPVPPIANDLTINGGALTTTAANVRLALAAANADGSQSGLRMSFSNDGVTWSNWQAYAAASFWQLPAGDGIQTVYGRVQNSAGAISSIVSDSITLDTGVQSEYSVTINNGALYTNQVAVQLTISAQTHTAEMQVSNDGGFLGVAWEPYQAHKAWQITRYRNKEITRLVYVRFRTVDGTVSPLYLDDIILDTDALHGHGVVADQGTRLDLTATDDLSGIDSMRVSTQPDFGDTIWEPFSTQRAWDFHTHPTAYVQFRDAASNLSPRYAVPAAGAVILPLILR